MGTHPWPERDRLAFRVMVKGGLHTYLKVTDLMILEGAILQVYLEERELLLAMFRRIALTYRHTANLNAAARDWIISRGIKVGPWRNTQDTINFFDEDELVFSVPFFDVDRLKWLIRHGIMVPDLICHVHDSDLHSMVEVAKFSKEILNKLHFTLTFDTFTPKALSNALQEIFSNETNLLSLKVTITPIRRPAEGAIYDAMEFLRLLLHSSRFLNLRRFVSDSDLQQITLNCPSLVSLEMPQCTINENSLQLLGDCCPHLRTLSFFNDLDETALNDLRANLPDLLTTFEEDDNL